MPSDPLPLSPETRAVLVPPSPLSEAWDAMLDDLEENAITPGGWKHDEPDNIVMTHRPRIEQEARTLARAEGLDVDVLAAVFLEEYVAPGYEPNGIQRDTAQAHAEDLAERYLAALSRLGERE